MVILNGTYNMSYGRQPELQVVVDAVGDDDERLEGPIQLLLPHRGRTVTRPTESTDVSAIPIRDVLDVRHLRAAVVLRASTGSPSDR